MVKVQPSKFLSREEVICTLRIAAVVPAYNAARYITDVLIALCRQTLPLAEIIVVDDGSTDETAAVVCSLSARHPTIRLERLSDNRGPAAARNHGLALTGAELVLFMDADDLAEPQLLETEYRRLREMERQIPERWVLCHSAYRIIDLSGAEIAPVVRWKQVWPEETLGYQLVRNHIISTSGVLVRREEVLAAGGFDSALQYAEDADLWLRLAVRGGFAYVDEPLVRVRRHPGNTSRRLNDMLEAERTILRRYPLEVIRKAIGRRRLPWWVNAADFVSVLYRLDRWEEGLAVILEVVDRKPEFAGGLFLLGLYYLRMGGWEEAANCFEKTLELAPGHGAALNNLGALLALQGKTDRAFALLTEAVTLFPGYLDAGHNLQRLRAGRLGASEVRFTWRDLRPVLTRYQE